MLSGLITLTYFEYLIWDFLYPYQFNDQNHPHRQFPPQNLTLRIKIHCHRFSSIFSQATQRAAYLLLFLLSGLIYVF
jgi:hypothetical protein